MERSLYRHPDGYYHCGAAMQDYATAVRISPVFAFALARLVTEFASRIGDELFGIVDIGCGDGALQNQLFSELPEVVRKRAGLWGIDRVTQPRRFGPIIWLNEIEDLPDDRPMLVFSNELFDALPYARLVQREHGLQELYVIELEEGLEWDERPAPDCYLDYFRRRSIELENGQFADISLEWTELYRAIAELPRVVMIVTLDYGFTHERLFDARVRRFGTAAAYYRHQVSRDLLARPGEQDLTAHVNFTDLINAGEAAGFSTAAFLRQAEFLLRLGVMQHPLLASAPQGPIESVEEALAIREQRESAQRLVLPDGIGEDIRVLVQIRSLSREGWSFQQSLWEPDRI